MAIEDGLKTLSNTVVDLVAQRRSQWGDAGGMEFETRFLRPLGEVVDELQNAVEKYTNLVDSALSELD